VLEALAFPPRWQSEHAYRIPRFVAVGLVGVLVDNVVLVALHGAAHVNVVAAAALATEVAILGNFVLNDRWTFARRRGPHGALVRGLRYNLVALVGLGITVLAVSALTALPHVHYVVANFAGIAAGSAWNYLGGTSLAWSGRRSGARGRPDLSRLLGSGRGVFLVSLAAYLAIAVYLVSRGVVLGDALSRVANGYYVLDSRDPHLGAIGFVWNPLPSVAAMPLLPLRAIWPQLLTQGLAAGVVSALFMAGAAYQLERALRELPVRALPRTVLTLGFALHPMILYYSGNGMSEAPFLFFLVMAARHLTGWSRSGDLARAVCTGMALAGAYLTRYEAVGPALGVVLTVALVSAWRGNGPLRRRMSTAMCDAAIVGAPFVVVFVLWSAASWVLVGSPFEQFSSQYGNSSQLALQHAAGVSFTATPADLGLRLAILEPLLLVACAGGAAMALRRRDPAFLAIAAVLVPELGFAASTFLLGMTFHWLRFFLAAVPLTVLMGGLALSEPRAAHLRGRLRAALRALCLSMSAAALLGPALPASALAMSDARVAPEEARYIMPALVWHTPTPNDAYVEERAVAQYLDRMQLPPASVLVDTFIGFPLVLDSTRPEQFVITSDRDFQSALSDPASAGVRYVLVPRNLGLGSVDAITKQYPDIYDSGSSFSSFVREFTDPHSSDDRAWRLYRVAAAPSR
jgi:putative flippase GtrA